MAQREIPAAVILVVLVVTTVLATLPLADLGFYAGDTTNLTVASQTSVPRMLLTPSGIRRVSSANYTPLMGVTLRFDWLLFGTRPFGYGLHSALWMLGLGLAATAFLRTAGADRFGALLAGILVVVAPATVAVTAWYSTRHYLIAATCALLSLAMMNRFAATGQRRQLLAALALYAISLEAKEIAFPLVLIAPILAVPARRRTVAIGYVGIACAYLLARYLALGSISAGYSPGSYGIFDAALGLARSWPRFADTVVVGGYQTPLMVSGLIAAHCLVAGTLWLAWRRGGNRAVAATTLVLAAPIVTVAPILSHPQITFWSRLDAGKYDRIAFAFAVSVLLAFCYHLLVPAANDLSSNAEPPFGRRFRRTHAVIAVILLGLAWTGHQTALHWRGKKFRAWQWYFVERHVGNDIVLTGDEPPSLQIFSALAAGDPSAVHLTVWGWNEDEAALEGADPRRVYLMLPGQAIRPAANLEEMLAWFDRYNRVGPSRGAFIVTHGHGK